MRKAAWDKLETKKNESGKEKNIYQIEHYGKGSTLKMCNMKKMKKQKIDMKKAIVVIR